MTIIMLYSPVCIPLGHGDFCVFCALFRLPNIGQGCNDITLFVNCNSLCAILPNDLCLSGEDLHGPFPISIVLHTQVWAP